MQFEVKGQEYFLDYVDEQESWVLFRPGPRGFEQIPVLQDSVQPNFGGVIIPFEAEPMIN